MALKTELLTWNDACKAFDEEDFDTSLELFDQIADSAKIHFNIGVVLATLQEHEAAIKAYVEAIRADQYFAAAYFQRGVSNFLLGDFENAIADFDDTLLYLRGNLLIDYRQLGMDYKLYSCEVLYNRGLCYLFMDEEEPGAADLFAAQQEKQTPDHDVIDQAVAEGIDGLSVFSLPPGLLFRPAESKIKNADKRDYLGSSKLIAAVERNEMFTGFKGAYVRKMSSVASEGDPSSAPASMLPRSSNQTSRQRSASVSNASPRNSSFGNSLNSTSSTRSPGGPLRRRATETSRTPQRPTIGGGRDRGDGGGGGGFGGGGGGGGGGGLESRMPQRKQPADEGRGGYQRRGSDSSMNGGNGRLAPGPGPSAMGRRRVSDNTYLREEEESVYGTQSNYSDPGNAQLRIKCHLDDARIVTVDPNISFDDLSQKIQLKFGLSRRLTLKYKDEDGELVMMTDDDDFRLLRSMATRPSDRLEIWCFK